MRYALVIEYDGSGFHGWQRQSDLTTVQQAVEQALSQVADHSVCVTCAGRTDAGVHAAGQVVHFDFDGDRRPDAWRLGANALLPPTVSVLWSRAVADDFHARFSAQARTYRYRICNAAAPSALDYARAWWVRQPLDGHAMREAAAMLPGERDFSAFRSADCQARHASRFVSQVEVNLLGELIEIEITANAFLHNMVRIIVGVLTEVGCGKRSYDSVEQLLRHGDRTQSGITAPPQGLCLAAVHYPEPFQVPAGRAAAAAQLTGLLLS